MDRGILRVEQSGSKAASDWHHQRSKRRDRLEVGREITHSLLQPCGSEVGAVRADLATLLVAVCVKIGLTLFSFHKLVFATMRDILQKSPPCLFSFPVRERKCSADGVLLVSFPQGLYLITTLY